jgi:hypothetical protein
MLEMVETAPQAEKRRDAAFDVEIAAVATALPSNVADQVSISRLAQQYYPQFAHMEAL